MSILQPREDVVLSSIPNQEKIKAKKKFIEEQNNIQKTALAKGERMKSADALRQNLRAAEFPQIW